MSNKLVPPMTREELEGSIQAARASENPSHAARTIIFLADKLAHAETLAGAALELEANLVVARQMGRLNSEYKSLLPKLSAALAFFNPEGITQGVNLPGWKAIVEPVKDAYWKARRDGKNENDALLWALDEAIRLREGIQ